MEVSERTESSIVSRFVPQSHQKGGILIYRQAGNDFGRSRIAGRHLNQTLLNRGGV